MCAGFVFEECVFEECVRELNSKYDMIKRKIAFIIDNCTTHGENL